MELYRIPLTANNKHIFKEKKVLTDTHYSCDCTYRIRTYDNKYGYTYYIDQEKIPLVPDWFTVRMNIGEDNYKLFNEVKKLAEGDLFTRSSLDYAFRKYPAIRSLVGIGNEFINGIMGLEVGQTIERRYICYASAFWPDEYEAKTHDFRMLVNNLMTELESGVTINFDDLEVNETLKNCIETIGNSSQKMPKWAKVALTVGGIICIKAIIKDAMNDSLDNLFGDSGNDFDGGDYDSEDVGSDNIDTEDPGSYSEIAFMGNKTVGDDLYIEKDTITLTPAGGGLGEKEVTVYIKSGTNTQYIFDGSIPKKIQGVSQVTINGIRYVIRK